MRQSPVRLALLADGNAAAQRAPHFSVIREIPDPVPPDPINTSADLIPPVRLRLLLKEKEQNGVEYHRLHRHQQLSCRGSETTSHFYLKDSFIRTLKYFIFILEHRFDLGVKDTALSHPGESINWHVSIVNRVTRRVQEKKCFLRAKAKREQRRQNKIRRQEKPQIQIKKKKRFAAFLIVLLTCLW